MRRTRSSSSAKDTVAATTANDDAIGRRTRSAVTLTAPTAAAAPRASGSKSQKPRRKKRRKSKSIADRAQVLDCYKLDGEEYRVGDTVFVAMENFKKEEEDNSTEMCQVCKKMSGSSFILECSGCLHGYHGRCLQPPLRKIPDGDWLCPRCNSGNPPPPPNPPRTALQMVLYGDNMLSLARIEGFIRNRDGSTEMEMMVQYYCTQDKTHRGRQKPFRARELYLEKGKFWEPADSIYRKATVCKVDELPDTEGDDVFLCEYMYDREWKRFTPLGKAGEALDEMDWAGGSDGEDDHTYQPEKDRRGKKRESLRKEGQVAALEEINQQALISRNMGLEDEEPTCPYAAMRQSLTTGAVPSELPCRDEEKACIKRFISEGITARGSTNVLYICGVPGTGKTASVIEVIFYMRDQLQAAGVQFVAINGLQVPSPQHVYSKLWERISGQRVSPARALSLLEQRFSSSTSEASQNDFVLVVVDEVDVLMTRDQAVLYNLFEWPMRAAAKLCVIAISNTHDLDERVLPRIASRLAASKLVFKPYNVEQLGSILKQRLQDHALVQTAAIEFAARKVSSDSGDARRVLELMRRAVEVAEADKTSNTSKQTSTPVGIRHVNEAIKEMYNSIHMQYLRSCALMEKLLLVGIAQETRSISRPECTLQGAVKRMSLFCQMIGQEDPKPGFMLPVAQRLSAKRLILAGPTSQHLKMKVALNVQIEDVAAVIKTDTSLQQLAGFL